MTEDQLEWHRTDTPKCCSLFLRYRFLEPEDCPMERAGRARDGGIACQLDYHVGLLPRLTT